MSNFEMLLLWGILGGPFVAGVTYLYGSICIKSIEDRQFVIFLMCLPMALIAVFVIPWSGGSFQSFIPISMTLIHWFYWFHEDFIKLLEGKN